MPFDYRGFLIPQYGDKPWAEVDINFNKTVIDFMLDNASKNGSVFITNITPTTSNDNISDIVKIDGYAVTDFKTTSNIVTVHVTALTGHSTYLPNVTINDIPITSFTQVSNQSQWIANVTIDLTGYNTITVKHSDGAIWQTNYMLDSKPTILNARFIGNYPNSQTELKANDNINFEINSDSNFDFVEIIDYGASLTRSYNVDESNTCIISITIANRGNTPTLHGIKLRIRKSNGTYSDEYITDSFGNTELEHVVKLNNRYPSVISFNLSYPNTQQAIKNSESATAQFFGDYYDNIMITTSSDLSLVNNLPTLTLTRVNGSYVVSTNNLFISMYRNANGATTNVQYQVNIVNIAPQISIVNSRTRYRSGGNLGTSVQSYTFDITSNQRLLNAPTVTCPSGTLGSINHVSGSNFMNWRGNLQVHDNDSKGTFNFNGLIATGLSGIQTNTFTGNSAYVIGGFVFRTLTVPAWTGAVIPVSIGTLVSNTTKLRCTNLSKGTSGSNNFIYQSTTAPASDRYTIITNNSWYNCDIQNAQSNSSGTMRIELEEVE